MKNKTFFATLALFISCISGNLISEEIKDSIVPPNEAESEISEWDASFEHAKLLIYLHKYDEAQTELDELLKQKPNSDLVKIEIAKIKYYQKNYSEALQILDKIPADQLTKEGKLLLADLYVAQKDYSKAEPLYLEYLKNSPEDDTVKFKLAELLSWQKKFDESLLLFRELLKQHPDDVQLRRKYAMVLMWTGKAEESAEELNKTLHKK